MRPTATRPAATSKAAGRWPGDGAVGIRGVGGGTGVPVELSGSSSYAATAVDAAGRANRVGWR
jgi:hypothetical protein